MPTGVKTDDRGVPLFVRDSHAASNNFGFGALRFLAVPKPKFLFFVRFVRIGADSTSQSGSSLIPGVASDALTGKNTSTEIGFLLKTIDRPKMTFETETLNQYNKKRVIQKRIDYKPINMKFHDTVDNKVFLMFQSYFKFYFADPQHSVPLDWSNDVIAGEFRGSAAGWGYLGSKMSGDLANYFSILEVYQIYGGRYNQFNLVNPKIQSFDPDELDYNGGTVSHEISMTLTYEGINYIQPNGKLSDIPNIITLMGLDKTNFFEVESGPIGSQDINTGDAATATLNSFASTSLNNGAVSANVSQSQNTSSGLSGGVVNVGSFQGNLNSPVQNSSTTLSQQLTSNSLLSAYDTTNTGMQASIPIASTAPDLRNLQQITNFG